MRHTWHGAVFNDRFGCCRNGLPRTHARTCARIRARKQPRACTQHIHKSSCQLARPSGLSIHGGRPVRSWCSNLHQALQKGCSTCSTRCRHTCMLACTRACTHTHSCARMHACAHTSTCRVVPKMAKVRQLGAYASIARSEGIEHHLGRCLRRSHGCHSRHPGLAQVHGSSQRSLTTNSCTRHHSRAHHRSHSPASLLPLPPPCRAWRPRRHQPTRPHSCHRQHTRRSPRARVRPVLRARHGLPSFPHMCQQPRRLRCQVWRPRRHRPTRPQHSIHGGIIECRHHP